MPKNYLIENIIVVSVAVELHNNNINYLYVHRSLTISSNTFPKVHLVSVEYLSEPRARSSNCIWS
jgi:hypothetical protein